jgi:DNA polymerase/3'-5' exonuclease PolX
MWLASYALSKGFRLKYSEGLVKDKVVVAGETEESIFEALGLPCPKPLEREVIDDKPAWV